MPSLLAWANANPRLFLATMLVVSVAGVLLVFGAILLVERHVGRWRT